MSSVAEEIRQLQLRILELEKKEQDVINKTKLSTEYNFNVINDILSEKKNRVERNTYSKSNKLAKYHDEQLINRLESIYNILQNLDERLKIIEDKE